MAYPILAPKDTWYTQGGTSIKRSTITEIDIKDTYTPAGAVTAQWDGSAAKDGSITVYVEGTKLTIAGNGSVKIQANTDSSYMFSDSKRKDMYLNLSTINGLDLIDTSTVVSMTMMFFSCSKLHSFSVSEFKTGKVRDMFGMFGRCNAIETLDLNLWDTSSCASFKSMFAQSIKLKDIILDKWDMHSATTTYQMFRGCTALTRFYAPGWNLGACTNAAAMFSECRNMVNFVCDNWNTKSFVDLNHMFADCASLTHLGVSHWDVSKVENFGAFLNDCSSLASVNLTSFRTSSAKAFAQMFERCGKLKSILGLEKFDTSRAVGLPEQGSFNEMFADCGSIEELDLSSFDTSVAVFMNDMFRGCIRLKKLSLNEKWNLDGVIPSRQPVLPTPNPTYIPGADGKWYDLSGKAYTPAEAIKTVPNTYFASKELARSEPVMMQNGTLIDIGEAIRTRRADAVYRKPNEMAAAIESIV